MDKPQSSSIRSSLESTTQCQIQITMARKEIPWRTCSQHSMDKFCQSERRPHTKPRRDSDDDHIDSWLRYGHTFLISFFLFLFLSPLDQSQARRVRIRRIEDFMNRKWRRVTFTFHWYCGTWRLSSKELGGYPLLSSIPGPSGLNKSPHGKKEKFKDQFGKMPWHVKPANQVQILYIQEEIHA